MCTQRHGTYRDGALSNLQHYMHVSFLTCVLCINIYIIVTLPISDCSKMKSLLGYTVDIEGER